MKKIATRIWLHVYESAVPMTMHAVAHDLDLEIYQVVSEFKNLTVSGRFIKSGDARKKSGPIYSVTKQCKIPNDVTLEDL